MIHIFLDSSVLLAFSCSLTGGSAFIIECCQKGIVKGYISQKVRFESKKNAENLGKLAAGRIEYILKEEFLTIIADANENELEKAQLAFNNPKDALILATAKQISHISFILSLDNGFFKSEVLKYVQPIEILKPGEFIIRFRSKLERKK